MSGRKQHYIPQVLLKGFSASPDAKSPPIFVYSRNRGCYKTNTKDTATEREFYSAINPEAETLDDTITDYENQLTQQLTDIKARGEGPIDAALPAAVITHLAIRNDHTRKTFANAGGQMLGAIGQMFNDTPTVRSLMGVDKPYSQSRAKQEVRKTIASKFPGLDRNKRAKLELMMMAKLTEGFDQFYEQQKPKFAALNTKLQNSVEDMAKGGHLKALGNSLAPELRIAALTKMRWRIAAGEFVLPDCVAMAIQPDESVRPYILTNTDDLHTVFMPISKQMGMMGTVMDGSVPLNENINAKMASCSSDFFIYPVEDDSMKSLMPEIGTRTSELITQLTDEAVNSSKAGSNKSEK